MIEQKKVATLHLKFVTLGGAGNKRYGWTAVPKLGFEAVEPRSVDCLPVKSVQRPTVFVILPQPENSWTASSYHVYVGCCCLREALQMRFWPSGRANEFENKCNWELALAQLSLWNHFPLSGKIWLMDSKMLDMYGYVTCQGPGGKSRIVETATTWFEAKPDPTCPCGEWFHCAVVPRPLNLQMAPPQKSMAFHQKTSGHPGHSTLMKTPRTPRRKEVSSCTNWTTEVSTPSCCTHLDTFIKSSLQGSHYEHHTKGV